MRTITVNHIAVVKKPSHKQCIYVQIRQIRRIRPIVREISQHMRVVAIQAALIQRKVVCAMAKIAAPTMIVYRNAASRNLINARMTIINAQLLRMISAIFLLIRLQIRALNGIA